MSGVDIWAYALVWAFIFGLAVRRVAAFIKVPESVVQTEAGIAFYWVALATLTAAQVWAACHALRFK